MRSTAVRLAATVAAKLDAPTSTGRWSKAVGQLLVPVGSVVGLSAAVLTDWERPAHGINPAYPLGAPHCVRRRSSDTLHPQSDVRS
jgi:hypothetical protein